MGLRSTPKRFSSRIRRRMRRRLVGRWSLRKAMCIPHSSSSAPSRNAPEPTAGSKILRRRNRLRA